MLGRLGAVSPRWDSACLSAFSATQADAEVLVDGGRDEMQVRVENDTVGHVLEALGQNVSLHYRSAAPLNKVIGGSFSGSLEQVVSRVLAGYDFVVRYNLQGVELFVVGESGAAPIQPPPIEASPTAQTASPVAERAEIERRISRRGLCATRQASMTCGRRREFRRAASARRLVRRPERRYMFRSVNENS